MVSDVLRSIGGRGKRAEVHINALVWSKNLFKLTMVR